MATAALLALVSATAAQGDAPWGDVNCKLFPDNPQCTIVVIDPGSGGGGGGNGPITCKLGGEIVPCYEPGFGWLGSDGCYYGKDPGGFLRPNEYLKHCYGPTTGNIEYRGIVWLPNPPAALGVLARRAVSQLNIPKPVIAANPALDAPQVVHVPVWWWVQPGIWQTRTATASIPGISITARATPTKITWYAGDGTSTVCTGPGTPWTGEAAPTAASPTCGHTYTTTSRTSPGGTFTLRAVITWNISWAGGGASGTEPSATTTATAAVEVTELRAVITG